MKLEIVNNTVSATAFASNGSIQVSLNSLAESDPSIRQYKFKIHEQKETMKIVTVYDNSSNFVGYVKLPYVKNVPNECIIDGTWSPVKKSTCTDLIITKKTG